MLAGELALAGVDVVVVERRPNQALSGSRAIGISARTIEVLDQRGIADRFLAAGQTAQITGFAVTRLDISDFPTRHNYGLALRQKHIERLLADVARVATGAHRWGGTSWLSNPPPPSSDQTRRATDPTESLHASCRRRRRDQAGAPREPVPHPGQVPGSRHAQRLVHGRCAHRARPPDAVLGRLVEGLLRAEGPDGLLSVRRVPHRPPARDEPRAPRHRRRFPPGGRRPWPGPRRSHRAGRGAGARQRWPGAARGVLHGVALHAPGAQHRIRHPLRVRHLRPGDPRRLAGRGRGQLAAIRQPVGDRAARDPLRRPVRRAHRRLRRRRHLSGPLASGAGREGHAVRHAGRRLRRAGGQPAAVVEGGSARVLRLPGVQHRRLSTARSPARPSRKRSARSSIRTTRSSRDASCASSSSISSCRARSRT